MSNIDARDLPRDAEFVSDVCVIGSGPAGTATAVELATRGIHVVVVEAGGVKADARLQQTYCGEFGDSTHHDPLELIRQKRLGGTSWQWGGRCAPLDEIDFETRPWVPNSGWPFSRPMLEPYYRSAQAYCGLGEFEYKGDRAVPSGWTMLEASSLELNRIWRWGPPVRFHGTLLSAARASALTVITHANVLQLLQERPGGPVRRLMAASQPSTRLYVSAKIFVLAAGGLESARLLLTSDGQSRTGIGNAEDLVGRFYMTHPVAEVGLLRPGGKGQGLRDGYVRSRDNVYVRRRIDVRESIQAHRELLNLKAAVWYPNPSKPDHRDPLLSSYALVRAALAARKTDFKSAGVHRRYAEISAVPQHLRNVAMHPARMSRFGATWVRRRWWDDRSIPSFLVTDVDPLRLRFDAEQSPDPMNRVTLADSRDSFGVRRLRLQFRVTEENRTSMHSSIELILQDLAANGLAQVDVPLPEEFADLPFLDGTHQMGVLRMAESPRRGVVDSDCRVHGCANLFVAGSSVFPTSGAVGPTLTIVALAIRLAERLRQELDTTEIDHRSRHAFPDQNSGSGP